MTDLAQDRDDIQALMAPPRTPNVYAALEHLNDEPTPEPAPTPTATSTATAEVPASTERVDREIEWSALGAERSAAGAETSWSAIGAEPVGPEVLRWRREDDDIVPTGVSGGRGRARFQLRRRSAA